MDLAGTWRAVEADESLRRHYPASDFDDGAWEEIDVPGHWRSSAAFAGSDGPLLYRTHFDAPRPADGRRAWLTFDGLFYQGDVWLDGSYVGDTEGYFFPHTFEVTEALRSRAEHVLALELTCSPQRDGGAKRNITGAFQHSEILDPDWNPGGIWRPVRVTETGPVRIAGLRMLCADAGPEQAIVRFRAALDAAGTCTVRLRTTIGGTDHEVEQPLSEGENRVLWQVVVERPQLWWPHALGDQPMHDVTVEVELCDEGRSVSDRRQFRTGLRQVRMRNWICSVNGERLFLKGTSQGPTRTALAEAGPEDFARDVDLAVDAGLDLLRVHGHVSRPELYDAADRRGLLLWQDFPLQWGYARGIRKQAVRQVREAVDLLGHHPSIALWCAHDTPPARNTVVLDAAVKRALEKADGTRPAVPHAPPHLSFGWRSRDERDLPAVLGLWPRLGRFVGELGPQAVPETADFLAPERWPDLDWPHLSRVHGLQKDVFDRRVPPADFEAFEEWQRATQSYQARVVRHHAEHLRRLKYRPAGGFCQSSLADGSPGVTWAVLDHERVPKQAYEALAAACAPVIVTADRPAAECRPGDALALDVHVVSDLRTPLHAVQVAAVLRWEGGRVAWSWEGDVAADSCERVGMVRAVVPDAPGPLVLELDLEGPGVKAANRYESVIRPVL